MRPIFFYGLFMDSSLLEEMGLHPIVHGPAALENYQIIIGNKATLVPQPGATANGVVMQLSDDEAATSYSQPCVADYIAEEVDVLLTASNDHLTVDCYNIAQDKITGPANAEYAGKLAEVVLKLGFPPAYADEISKLAS